MSARMPESTLGFPRDFDHCHKVIRVGSKSFHFASLLLPKSMRRAAFAIYAFCRDADDAVDLGSDPVRAIGQLMKRLDRIYAGKPDDDPIDRAFSCVVLNYEIPRALPDALLEGMLWDTQNRRYDTLEDLMGYAVRVAGTVGAMMTVLMGNRSKEAIARATDLGIAMQLTNIARDVGEDAGAGRLYLPVAWFDQVGLDVEQFLQKPAYEPGLGHLIKRLLDTAEPIYERGLSGVELLPARCRASIRAAGNIYREIGAEVRANQYNSISQRAYVSKKRKLTLLAEAAFESSGALQMDAPLPASVFLVDAVTSIKPRIDNPAHPTRALWVLDLFTRLAKRDLMSTGGGD